MFIFNNIRSDNMGLIVKELPPISSADERINEIEVPGMDGELLQSDGFKNIEKKVVVHYEGNNPDRLIKWLRGGGKVIFGNINDRYYKAYINNAIPLEEILRNKLYYFPIIFTCKPCSYLLEGEHPIILTKPTVLNNIKCSHRSFPTIKIFGSSSCTLSVNGRTFSIRDIGGSITIDSERQQCNRGEYMEGEFPYFEEGNNNIVWSGNITSVEITPYWRSRI